MDNYMYFISWAQLFGYYMFLFHMSVGAEQGSGSRHFSDEWGSFQPTVGRDYVS